MKLGFRWFGNNDPVPLNHIRQIPGMEVVVHQVRGEALGELLNQEALTEAKAKIQSSGLSYEVFESLPIHHSIKLGTPERNRYVEIYKQNIRLLAGIGLKVIVYNFRPIIRWARTEIYKPLDDGSSVSTFYKDDAYKIDPFMPEDQWTKWHKEHGDYIYSRQLTTDMKLDGYYNESSRKILLERRKAFQELGKEGLWDNLTYFLREIIPVAEECDVRMAIHPDDPPWDIYEIPRLMTNEASIDRLLDIVDSKSNGIVFCSGTFGSDWEADVVKMADKYLSNDRIPFAHIRNVNAGPGFVEECAHYSPCGSIDMPALIKVFHDYDYEGYIRSDHGRMIWGEEGKPGNGMFDRALGVSYILGIWETLGLK